MTTQPLSSCCKAPVKRTDVSNGEFIGYNAFVCDECDMPCSIEQHNPFDLSTPIPPGYEVKNANTASYPPASTGHGVEGNIPTPRHKIGDSIVVKESNFHTFVKITKGYLPKGGTCWEYWTTEDRLAWIKETEIILLKS